MQRFFANFNVNFVEKNTLQVFEVCVFHIILIVCQDARFFQAYPLNILFLF